MDYVSDTLIINADCVEPRARACTGNACLISDLIDTLVSVRQPANKGLEHDGCTRGLISEENLLFFHFRVTSPSSTDDGPGFI